MWWRGGTMTGGPAYAGKANVGRQAYGKAGRHMQVMLVVNRE